MRRKWTIKDIREVAIQKGGRCLSEVYTNCGIKLEWECKLGHRWFASSDSVIRISWCPYCAGKNKTIKDMRQLAKNKGGKCLSKTYNGVYSKLQWQCKLGHVWETCPNNILSDRWCPECGKITISKMRLSTSKWKFADVVKRIEQRGGVCLSSEDEYRGYVTKIRLKCQNGHEWATDASCILGGHWCSICKSNLNENKCRSIIEQMTGKLFGKKRIAKFILDGYNDGLNLAFEYNGQQHYMYVDKFHKHEGCGLDVQQQRDAKLCNLCRDMNIKLLIIPYFVIKDDRSLIDYIDECLTAFNIDHNKNIDLSNFYLHCSPLAKLKEIALSRNGKCLSNDYINAKTKLSWQCECGYVWQATPDAIMNKKTWCPLCKGKRITNSLTKWWAKKHESQLQQS